ncbi:MAG TPA: hypothetical protein EYP34_02890 [Chromatiaceae bacterium]|nr:hypothetical protein [Chromatiaceae bacterium]
MQEGQNKGSNATSNRLWLIISLVIAVTVVAVLMVPDRDKKADDIPLPAAVQPAVPTNPDPIAPAVERVADTDASATGVEGEAARAYLAGSPLLENVLAQARTFQSEGKLGDAWLLYFKAAKDGSADAALALAEQADPSYFKRGETVLSRPDVVQAHKWYEQARRNGSEMAEQRLQQLLTGLEEAAAAGDEQAAVLLEEWK